MVAVTIGVGKYGTMARYAAKAVHEMTNLDTVILDERHFAESGLASPHFLKLRIFDLVDADAVMFFDADMVCLNKWDPKLVANPNAIVAVADRQHPLITEACRKWGIALGEYFNTGLLILDRTLHRKWLNETELFTKSHPPMPLYDQTPLNIVRHRLGLSLDLIDRRHNWIGFGNGLLCYQVPVFMAHTLCADSKMANIDFFEGRLQLKSDIHLEINEAETVRLRGQWLSLNGDVRKIRIYLNHDGTIRPFDSPAGGNYWCVVDGHKSPVLVVASETEAIQTFTKISDDRWRSTDEFQILDQ
jgi:hypothetical protein